MNRRDALKKTAGIMGMTITASAGIGLLKGCTPSGDPNWQPGFLEADQIKMISSIAESILPKSDTPGAIDLHVPEFIDLMLHDNYNPDDQKTFQEGLASFKQNALSKFSNTFEDCEQEEKIKLLKEEETKSLEYFNKSYKKTFYLILKELTILGYYTSEYVMTNMLDYHPVPGRYDGCIPITENNKLYVDNNV